jgi:uncharacterized protein
VAAVSAVALSAQTGVEGTWQGTLSAGAAQLRLQLNIKKDSKDGFTATLDSLDQGAMGLRATGVSLKLGAFHFDVPGIGGSYDGTLNEQGTEISGAWSQGGFSAPLNFTRAGKPKALLRPQEPNRPLPYDEEEVTYPNQPAGVTLSGTLTLPRGKGPFPAALLISGSGPQDRDENILGHRPFLVLADRLTRGGVAVLRYDDRGTAKSTGNFAAATTLDFAADADAGVAYLRIRKEIDPKRLGLIGHSEGANVAAIVASRSPVAFVVMMAPSGVRGEDLLISQTTAIMNALGLPLEQVEKTLSFNKRAYAIARQEKDPVVIDKKVRGLLPEIAGKQQIPKEVIESQIKMLSSPWFRHFIDYDPAPAMKALRSPVLAMFGEKDVQVPADENLKAVRDALQSGSNKDFSTIKLPGLNHLFQTAGTGLPMEYGQIEETIAPAALDLISKWLAERLKQPVLPSP